LWHEYEINFTDIGISDTILFAVLQKFMNKGVLLIIQRGYFYKTKYKLTKKFKTNGCLKNYSDLAVEFPVITITILVS